MFAFHQKYPDFGDFLCSMVLFLVLLESTMLTSFHVLSSGKDRVYFRQQVILFMCDQGWKLMLAQRPMASKFYIGLVHVDFMERRPDWLVHHEKQKSLIWTSISFFQNNILKLFFLNKKSLFTYNAI